MTAEMEQSPKQSPAAVEPVADLIERLEKYAVWTPPHRQSEKTLLREAAASLSQLSTKLENAERGWKAELGTIRRQREEYRAERDELRAKLAEAQEAAFEEAAQIAEATGKRLAESSIGYAIAKAIRARAVKGAGQS